MAKKAAVATKPERTDEQKAKQKARRDWVDEYLRKNPDAKPKEIEEAMLRDTEFENDKGDSWGMFIHSRRVKLTGGGKKDKSAPAKSMTLAQAAELCDRLKLEAAEVKTLLESLRGVDITSAGQAVEKYSQFVHAAGNAKKAKELIALL